MEQLERDNLIATSGISFFNTADGTHTLRRPKAIQIYRKTGNLRAVSLLLGYTKWIAPSGTWALSLKMHWLSLRLLKSRNFRSPSRAAQSGHPAHLSFSASKARIADIHCRGKVYRRNEAGWTE